ncbi:hypothetical protein D7004_01225 [Pedobacter jejuensis]|uniref:Uncharacterized protein n=1 Tax=Pedobacter jejuensis TaxID=1268550 RepID=A0A3N0C248_9SPHI|nr:hypothetical protein D7004_01225 [Pedobacter jejuensis]
MKVLLIVVFVVIIVAFLYAAYDMAKNRRKIHLINILLLVFVPYLWPFIYLLLTKRLVKYKSQSQTKAIAVL